MALTFISPTPSLDGPPSPARSSRPSRGHPAPLQWWGGAIAAALAARQVRIPRRAREKKVVEVAERSREVLPYAKPQEQIAWPQWPNVLDPMKRNEEISTEDPNEMRRQNFQGKRERTVRTLMQSFLRMQDPMRIIRFGIEHPEGDGRGWAAVALTRLNKTAEAAKLAAGPDGQTPCGYQTLRYVAHACAKVGAVEAAFHLSHLQTCLVSE